MTTKAGITTGFTKKEARVMRLICQQFSSKEIAEKMGLSHRTIDDYREKIYSKTKAKNGIGVALYAVRNGYYKL